MASVKGKVIALTGGASGIGFETAKLLVARGAKVSIADVQNNLLDDAAAAIRKHSGNDAAILTSVVDVRDSDSVAAWISKTVETFGQLDGAANIAGVFKSVTNGTVETEDENIWDLMLSVNLTGVMHCMRAELAHLKAGGSIVNAASILGVQGASGAAAYSASKHGVVGLTRSAAKEAGKKGVRVNCFAPGYIETPMLRSVATIPERAQTKEGGASSVALGRLGQPEEVATLIAFLLSDDASFITGNCISIDGGWNC